MFCYRAIGGETGTGKEILARAMHEFPDRAQEPFAPFNCSAIPRELAFGKACRSASLGSQRRAAVPT